MNFDDLIAGGEGAINDLIGRQETLQLEFKANDSREPIFVDGALTKSGRKMLAKEASAFANSAGGVIIFGVDCRAVDGIDQAEKLTPIAAIDRAETTVRDAASELLQPRHDGIRVASIRCDADISTGFIIVDVPRSERRPHRSEATDQKQYFKRSGSRSYPMERYDIEDAFKRASSPALTLCIAFHRAMTMGDEAEYHLQIAIKNSGEVTAKSITMQLWDRSGAVFGHDNYSRFKNQTSDFEGRRYIAAPADFVVHPGETRQFHHFTFRMSKRDGSLKLGNELLDEHTSVSFKFSLGAENMRVEDRDIDLLDLILAEAGDYFRHE